jgi:hypothetical protein
VGQVANLQADCQSAFPSRLPACRYLTSHFNPAAFPGNIADPAYGLFFGDRHRRFTPDFDVIF